jgi:hypothetical protein
MNAGAFQAKLEDAVVVRGLVREMKGITFPPPGTAHSPATELRNSTKHICFGTRRRHFSYPHYHCYSAQSHLQGEWLRLAGLPLSSWKRRRR